MPDSQDEVRNRDFLLGEIRGQMNMAVETLNIMNNKQESIMLSLETINQKLLGFMQSTGIYRTTCEKHFMLIDEKLSRDYAHLNRLDHEIKNAPAKRRRFWVTVLAHMATVVTSVAGVLTAFKTGIIK
jgi:hypothetical protein